MTSDVGGSGADRSRSEDRGIDLVQIVPREIASGLIGSRPIGSSRIEPSRGVVRVGSAGRPARGPDPARDNTLGPMRMEPGLVVPGPVGILEQRPAGS